MFGCGDSNGFSTTFRDSIFTLYECAMAGATSADGYTFDASTPVVDRKFAGQALDKTQGCISAWVEAIPPEL